MTTTLVGVGVMRQCSWQKKKYGLLLGKFIEVSLSMLITDELQHLPDRGVTFGILIWVSYKNFLFLEGGGGFIRATQL